MSINHLLCDFSNMLPRISLSKGFPHKHLCGKTKGDALEAAQSRHQGGTFFTY